MTVSTSTRRISYAGNGATAVFAVPFKFPANGDLRVLLTSAAGVETVLVLAAGYTVTGAGSPSGGTVTTLTPPAVGTTLTIKRVIARTQETAYVPNDPFPAASHEAALDKLTMISQEDGGELQRALVVPETDARIGAMVLPPVSARAGLPLVFDVNGLPAAGPSLDTILSLAAVAPAGLPAVTGVTTIAALLALSVAGLVTGSMVRVCGYYSAIDLSGGGTFVWDADSDRDHDGGLVFLPVGHVGDGRWLRIVEGRSINAFCWGAKNQSGFNNTPIFQTAITVMTDASYGYNDWAPGVGYNIKTPSILEVDEGRWDFLTGHPTQTDRVLWQRKPITIRGAGQDKTHFVMKIDDLPRYFLAADLAGPGYTGADYGLGGGISDFCIVCNRGAVRGSGILVLGTFPSAWDAFKIERFQILNPGQRGILVTVGGGVTTTYGCIVQEGKILGMAAGCIGLEDEGAYNYFANMDIYQDAPLGFSTCYKARGIGSTWINVRVEGYVDIDAPLAQFIGCGTERCDFPNPAREMVRINRVGLVSAYSMTVCVHRPIVTLERVSAVLARCTTSLPHLLTNGDEVRFNGSVPAAFAITAAVTVTSPTVFTFPLAADPITNATTLGWFAVKTGSQVAYGIAIYGQDVRMERITFTAGQPAWPILWATGATGVIDGCSTDTTPIFKPEDGVSGPGWRALRLTNAPTITDLGWEAPPVTSLPAATDHIRGIRRHLLGVAGVADRHVVGHKNAADAFSWVDTY